MSSTPAEATSERPYEGRLLTGSVWHEAVSPVRFDVSNPATGERVGSVADADGPDVCRAIDAAHLGLEDWRRRPAIERSRLLQRAAAILRERRALIAKLLTAEQGKPLEEAAGEVDYAAGFFEWFAGEAERIYGQVVPTARPDKRILVFRQPVGVVAAITPWNFPAAMLTRKLGPAIAAGCTSVVKPSRATPITAIEICRAIQDAGAPPGLVNLVTSTRSEIVADVLMADSRVRKISFTGSTEVGKELIRRSANQVKRLSLELGGHAPFVVFEDAMLDTALDQLMASKFRNAGQTCICANRIYVQRTIYREFVDRLAARVADLNVGVGTRPGVQIGPLIDHSAILKAQRHVDNAVAGGAKLVIGGGPLRSGEHSQGHFFAPTVLDGITSDMLIASEETFAPVAGLTPFETDEEAIRAANDTRYGLAAYFHTRDYARLFRVAERLDFGVIGANDGAPSLPSAPFGGLRESGYGREGGAFGIDEYVDIKYVSIGIMS